MTLNTMTRYHISLSLSRLMSNYVVHVHIDLCGTVYVLKYSVLW